MQTYTLKIQHENIAEKVRWVLKHFEKDGVIIQKDEEQNSIKSSIKKSVKELNEVKTGNLKAKDVSELLSAL